MNQKLFLIACMIFILGLAAISVPVANGRTEKLPTYKGGAR